MNRRFFFRLSVRIGPALSIGPMRIVFQLKGLTVMPHCPLRRVAPLFLAVLISFSIAAAGQRPIVSTMKNVRAVSEARGYFIAPAHDLAGRTIPGDEAPTQAFEVVGPSASRVTLGRLFTSCSCIRLEAPKTTFERGERVVLTLRNVRPTPPGGQTYAVYVQLTGPVRTTLRYDTFVQSDRFIVAKPVEAAEAGVDEPSEPEETETIVDDAEASTPAIAADDEPEAPGGTISGEDAEEPADAQDEPESGPESEPEPVSLPEAVSPEAANPSATDVNVPDEAPEEVEVAEEAAEGGDHQSR